MSLNQTLQAAREAHAAARAAGDYCAALDRRLEVERLERQARRAARAPIATFPAWNRDGRRVLVSIPA